MTKTGQIKVIQALRGIAALLVMVYHKREVLNTVKIPFGEFFFGAGAMGVDLFFIVSGFIMILVNEGKRTHFSNVRNAWYFLVNRVFRIVPLYYLTILLFYWLAWNGTGFLHDAKSVSDIQKSLVFVPLDFSKAAPFYGYAAITVGWTLNYEMFFYGLLTICILFGRYRYVFFSIVILALLLLIPWIFKGEVSMDAHHGYHFIWSYLNLMTNPIIWDFILGMLLGGWYVYKKPNWNKAIYFTLFSFFSIWISLNLLTKWNAGHGVTHWALPLLGLVASLVFYENQYGIKVPKWLLFMGKISFSLYLLHPVMQYETEYLFKHHGLEKQIETPIYLLVSVLMTLLLSTVGYYLIENHFSRILKHLVLSKKLSSVFKRIR